MEKKLVFLALFIFLFTSTYSQNSQWEWARTLGASIDDDIERNIELYGCKVAIDSKGNSYVAGLYSDTIMFNGEEVMAIPGIQEVDVFLAKYGSNGEPLWIKSFGAKGPDFVMGVVVDSNDNVFVTGGFESTLHVGDSTIVGRGEVDGFLVSFTSAGQHRFSTSFGSDKDDLPTDIACDGKNIFITGGCLGQYFNYNGIELYDKSFFVIKINVQGLPEWVSSLDDNNGYIRTGQIAPDHHGGCYISGKLYEITIGNDTIKSSGFNNTSLVHITSQGIADWVQTIDNCQIVSIDANSTSVCVLANFQDSIVISDSIFSSPNINKSTPSTLTAIYSRDGIFKNVYFGSGANHVGYDVCADSLGRFIISGRCGRDISFGNMSDTVETVNSIAGFVARIDELGNTSLLITIPTQAFNSVFLASVSSNVKNEIIVAGFYRDSILFDSERLFSVSSDPDVIIAKIGSPLSVSKYSPQEKKAKSFPNPSTGFIKVNYSTSSPSPVTITLHDILGREVLRREMGVQSEGEHEESLDV
ncbi:MAG TPA: hypothetical protein VIX80_03030, partial [Candidatus Kapabacteria bacterium]